MSLMKLAPESVRLRRMAKARAAGEMSEDDYRAARRDVIDNFPPEPVDDDDTRPRWPEEPTLRNGSVAAPADRPETSPVPEPAPSRRWWWLLGLGLAAVAAVLAIPDAWADSPAAFDVPPVSERNPDPAGSPRLTVRDVRVVWGGDADAGSMPAEILDSLQQRAEQALNDVKARNAPGPHGFTPDELREVARFLDVLGVHKGDGELDAADARDLSALIREQRSRRGVSVVELEQAAAAVQTMLRERGYFLAVAYVPAQRLEDGVVRIDVLPGRLGDVVVEGGDSEPVERAFVRLLGQPVTVADVSSRLQALNALPGVTAQASFGPGAEVGESRLHLDLLEQRDWVASVTADNDGDGKTGDQRLGATAAWLNPRGAGDRLSAGALVTVNPSNQTYGYVDYDTPLAGNYRLSARLGNNDFSEHGPVPVDGGGVYFDLAARRSLSHTRRSGLTVVLAGARQSLDWGDGVDQTVTIAGAGLAGHRVLDRPRIAADAAVSLSAGDIGGDRFSGQDSRFWLLELDSQAWMPVSLPWLPGEQKLRMRLSGQWSDSLLPATRRFTLGGASRARAYDRSQFLADRGMLLGLEVRTPLEVGELVAFGDLGYGQSLQDGDRTSASLSDLGLAWEARLTPSLSSRLSWAVPITTRGSGDVDDDGARLFWSLRYDR